MVQALRDNGEIHHFEALLTRPDGSEFWGLFSIRLNLEEECLEGVITDISTCKRLEAELLQQKRFLDSIVENIPLAVFTKDANNEFRNVLWNKACEEIFGIPRSEALGRNVQDMCPPEHAEFFLAKDREAIEQGKLIEIPEEPFESRSRGSILLRTLKVPLLDGDGNPGHLLCISEDITVAKKAEADLANSLALLQATFESIADGILAIDHFGNVVSYNQKFLDMWGLTVADISLPTAQERLQLLASQMQDPAAFIERVQKIYTEITQETYDVLKLKDGRVFERYSQPQKVADKILGRVWTFRDITATVRRKEALRLIVEGTASKTGEEFLKSLVRYLAEVLRVRCALVTRFANASKTRVRTLAFWQGDGFYENFECDLSESPCEEVLKGQPRFYPAGVQELFPNDATLVQLGVQSYSGMPLIDAAGNILGHLAVLDNKPMENDPASELILRIFAARAGAELERKLAEEELEHRAKTDSLLSSISKQFIDSDADTAINFALKAIGEFTGSDRSYVFHFYDHQRKLSNTHEWCAEGIEPFIDQLQGCSIELHSWSIQTLLKGQILEVSSVNDLPDEVAIEREDLQRQLIQSLVIVPMIHGGMVVGCIGLDAVRCHRNWSSEDISLLRLVGEIIAIGQARQEAEEQLRQSEETVRALLNAPADAALLLDITGQIIALNERAAQNFQRPANELVSQQFFDLFDAETAQRRRSAALQAITTATAVHIGETEGAFYCIQSFYPVFNARKEVTRLAFFCRDMTEQKQTEEALRQAKEAAEAANRAKSTFLANMSHELRTPLNAILGFTQLLTRDSSLSTEQQQQLEIVGRSGEHLLSLINDVLEMSKIEAGHTSLNISSFDLYGLLDRLQEMLQLRTTAKGLELIFEREPAVPQYINADESKLRQILINLLSNAIKFTETGCVNLRVKSSQPSSLETHSTFLQFEVEDTGPGIKTQELETLFEAFVQTETGRNSQQGTGLGLAICRQFARLMEGEISVSSVLGSGTIFRFEIKVSLADAMNVITKQVNPHHLSEGRRVVRLQPDQPQYRILIVEDRWENRLLLVKLLEPLGFAVREAENGLEGISLWESWEPHLILMDMRMPVMDGYEATKHIKNTVKGQATAIVALTASAFEENRSVVLAAGCDDFIRKPLQASEILLRIGQHLGVKYVYSEEEPATSSPVLAMDLEEFANSTLTTMPKDWVLQLHQAALSVDAELIFQILEQIPTPNPEFETFLADLVNNFRFDRIVALTASVVG